MCSRRRRRLWVASGGSPRFRGPTVFSLWRRLPAFAAKAGLCCGRNFCWRLAVFCRLTPPPPTSSLSETLKALERGICSALSRIYRIARCVAFYRANLFGTETRRASSPLRELVLFSRRRACPPQVDAEYWQPRTAVCREAIAPAVAWLPRVFLRSGQVWSGGRDQGKNMSTVPVA